MPMADSRSTGQNGFGGRLWSRFRPSSAPNLAERTRRRVTLYLIPFLFCLYILAYLDRVNVSVAALDMSQPPEAASVASAVGLAASAQGPSALAATTGYLSGKTTKDHWENTGGLAFNSGVIGWGAGFFFVGYLLLEIPSTWSVTRWGARWVFVRVLVLWGLCAALVGFIGMPLIAGMFSWIPTLPEERAPMEWIAATFHYINHLQDTPAYQFYFLRFMLGFFEGGFFPSVIMYLSIWFRQEDRAKAIASFMAAIPISSMFGLPLSGLLLDVNWFGLEGWRWIFIIEGIAPVAAGFVTLFFLPDNPRKAKWLRTDEREWLLGELEREQKSKENQGHGLILHHLGMVLLLTFVYFCLNLPSYGLTMFMPKIIQTQSGASSKWASILSSLPYVLAFIAMLVNGWHSDRTRERPWHVAIPLTMLSIGYCLAALASTYDSVPMRTVSVLVMIFCVGTFMYAHLPAFWPIPTMFLGASAAAAAIGFINMFGNLGGFVGPAVVGWVSTDETSFTKALWFLAAWPFTAALIILVVGYVRAKAAAPSRLGREKSASLERDLR
jgi:ACS family tartrate transporter-like MFS transporter